MSRTIRNSSSPFEFQLMARHIRGAQRRNPYMCAIARALRDALRGRFQHLAVGSACTKIYTANEIIRYRTPSAIKRALPTFDRTGRWELPPGQYTLLPYVSRPRRVVESAPQVRSAARHRASPSRLVVRD